MTNELFEKINEALLEFEVKHDVKIAWYDYNEAEKYIYGEFINDENRNISFAINLK